MASPQDVPMGEGNGNADIHEPFTVEDNIHQLNAIDKSIVKLMHHTGTALNALTIPQSSAKATSEPKSQLDPPSQKDDFHAATNSFLDTLHSVDVRMKRQIMALEEAGIVSLTQAPTSKDVAAGGANAPKPASLKPNGMGAVGSLDVGWLNSRGNRVERDMEAELWGRTRELLEKDSDAFKRI